MDRPRILLSDFGECENLFTQPHLHNRTGCTGTLEFTAPELLRGDRLFSSSRLFFTSASRLQEYGNGANDFLYIPYEEIISFISL
jgi:serine/threonine protein kinase